MEAIFVNLTVEKNVLAFNFFLSSSANEQTQVFPVGERREGERTGLETEKKAYKRKSGLAKKGQHLSQYLRQRVPLR